MKFDYQKLSVATLGVLLAATTWGWLAEGQSSQTPAANPPQQQQQQPDQSTPDSGGPGGDNGAIAIPKKAEKPDVPPPPPEPKVKNPPGMGNYSLRVDVPEVTLGCGRYPAENARVRA